MSEPDEVELNLVSRTAVNTGTVLSVILCWVAVLLSGWVLWHRKAQAVRVMQPFFLVMTCFGCFLISLTFITSGKDDTNTTNMDQVCTTDLWLHDMGTVFILAAMFSKLWRISKIYHAANSFRHTTVTLKNALAPFAILMTLDLIFLTTATVLDPPVWKREPVDENESNTVGYCFFDGTTGQVFASLSALLIFVSIIILCVQAYRARDVHPEFSQVRGIALSLFSWLQIEIVSEPMFILIEETNTTARYVLTVVSSAAVMLSLFIFIFGPLVCHQRELQREGRGNRPPWRSTEVTVTRESSSQGARLRVVELEAQVEKLSSRIKELETVSAACSALKGNDETTSVDSHLVEARLCKDESETGCKDQLDCSV